jgi:hypothetical protein
VNKLITAAALIGVVAGASACGGSGGGPVTATSLAQGIGCSSADFSAGVPGYAGMKASYAPITSTGSCSESPTRLAEFFVLKNTTARDNFLSYIQQSSPSVCLIGVEGTSWVAMGMSNSFANAVQAKDGGTRIHVGGGSVCS